MKIFYKQYSSEGEPLIILHGLFGNQGNWSTHAKKLASKYAVYAFDARNHGRSQWCPDMSYPEMAQDVADTMRALEIEQANFIGHSMGGKTAMQLALLEPDKIAKLVIVDIAPVTYTGGPDAVLEALQKVNLQQIKSRHDADQCLAQYIPEEGVRNFLLTNLRRNKDSHYGWRFNLAALVDNFESIKKAPSENKEVGPFLKTVVFIKGGDSNYILPEHRDSTLQLFPQATMKIIESAGHWVHSEKPVAFLRIIEKYLSS